MSKQASYLSLVQSRKSCHVFLGLTNPADCANGIFDTDDIGPWSHWQGNLDAKLMVIGQDWGDTTYYTNNEGHESDNNPTNQTLIELLKSVGIHINPPSVQEGALGLIFLTNAILCLKQGGLQAPVRNEWFTNCGRMFLRPTIELVGPKVLITLGERAFNSVRNEFGLGPKRFKEAVNSTVGIRLLAKTLFFPMYHCGRRILNTHRSLEQQKIDWQRVKRALAD